MNHILAIPAAICCVLVAYSTLNAELANKIKVLHIMGTPSDEEKIWTSVRSYYFP